MKKIYLLFFVFSCLGMRTITAQYTDIVNFNGTGTPQGLSPYGSVTPSLTGDTLFAVTSLGGTNNDGCVFLYTTTGYRDIHDFNGADGEYPTGTLTLSPSSKYMFGLSSYGGTSSFGDLFLVNTSGTTFYDLFNFDGINGAYPLGAVTLSVTADSLFFMTSYGGVNNYGNICVLSSSGYTDLHDFNFYDGANPYGSLTLINGGTALAGLCSYGGNSSYGDIFTINTNGSGFADIFDFNETNGAYPFGSLTPSVTKDTLYGTSSWGGAWGYGNLYSLSGSGFTDLYDFNSSGGAYPNGDVTLSGGVLYGMASAGGVSNGGTIFSVHPDGSNYIDLFDMTAATGEYPYGDVVFANSGIRFFGMTSQGGTYNDGVVFNYKILTAGVFKVTGVSCSNSSGGGALARVSGGISPYTYLWSPGGATTQGIDSLTMGSYTVTVTDNTGSTATAVAVISWANLSIRSTRNVNCYGGDNGYIDAGISGGTAPYWFSWSNGEWGPRDRRLSAGTYTITVTDSCGMTATASATITQPMLLTVTDSVLANVHCSGDSTGSLAATATGGASPYTYLWSDANSQTTATATGLSAGTYTITVTDTNGCTAVDSAIINQPSKPPLGVTIARAKNVSCSGSFDGMALALASGGSAPFTYAWSPSGDTTSLATGLSAGIYNVQITDTRGCNAVAVANISQPSVLRVSDTTISSLTYAFPSGGTPPYTYSWTPGGLTGAMVSGISAGTYTVVVTDANACEDSAVVFLSPPGIEFYIPSWLNTGISCNPGYIYFPIMATQDTLQRFNSCVIDLQLSSEFIGDSATNGGVIIVPGINFQPGPGNDYDTLSVTNLSDSVIQIAFGNPSDSSPNGTFLPISDTMTLFTVKLKIQDCFVTPVQFADTYAPFSATYTALDSNIASIDLDTISSMFVCPSCAHYPCSSSDGTIDSLCCCIDSFTYVTSYDTLYNYFYHNMPYNNTGYAGTENYSQRRQCLMGIDSISPHSINAGTNSKSIPTNSSILTIWGDMFDRKQGSGFFVVTDANRGTLLALDTTDILSWSNNKIVIKMPSYSFGNDTLTPGSGPFELFNSCDNQASGNLQINYNIQNGAVRPSEKIRPNIVMVNQSESYNFVCDTSVSHNHAAFGCVKKAISTWNCLTGVNWKLSNDTNIALATTLQDGISDIYFSNAFTDSATLMLTQPFYLTDTCYDSYDSVTFINEADVKIRTHLPHGLTWNYDTTGAIFSGNIAYFYNVLLHELGHAHGLLHINDDSSLMYRSIIPGYRPLITSGSTYPGPATLAGALDMIHTSVLPANAPVSLRGSCPFVQLDTSRRHCFDPTLGVS